MFQKVRWIVLVLLFSLVFGLPAEARAGHRYFYCRDNAAYYCVQPTRPTSGCYVICDTPNVKMIDGYSTISSAAAQDKIASVSPRLAPSSAPTIACCDSAPPASSECPSPPMFVGGCNCTTNGTTTPITGQLGPLTITCEKSTFYQATGTIDGTIPVPQLCLIETETFSFRPVNLNYPCNKADASNTDCSDCSSSICNNNCVVKGCEVFLRSENCQWKCVKCPRAGTLLIAIRTALNGNQLIADVFIGKAGHAIFPEYPTNLAVIRGRTQAEVRSLLQNQAIDFQAIITGSQSTDLISQL